MPYQLKLILENGNEILSPYIVPDNNKSKYWLEDRKIERHVIKYGKLLVKRKGNGVVDYECVHTKGES